MTHARGTLYAPGRLYVMLVFIMRRQWRDTNGKIRSPTAWQRDTAKPIRPPSDHPIPDVAPKPMGQLTPVPPIPQ